MRRTTLAGKVFRAALWVAFGLFFLFPLYAMADFSTRNLIAGGRTLRAWQNLVADEALYQSIVISLLLAVFTVVGMLLVLVLPFAYRAIDASLASIDLRTLAEAARSLGAGWATTILRVVVPNIWSGILSAAFISIAVVLGEYTIASLSGFETLQVQIVAIGKTDGP